MCNIINPLVTGPTSPISVSAYYYLLDELSETGQAIATITAGSFGLATSVALLSTTLTTT